MQPFFYREPTMRHDFVGNPDETDCESRIAAMIAEHIPTPPDVLHSYILHSRMMRYVEENIHELAIHKELNSVYIHDDVKSIFEKHLKDMDIRLFFSSELDPTKEYAASLDAPFGSLRGILDVLADMLHYKWDLHFYPHDARVICLVKLLMFIHDSMDDVSASRFVPTKTIRWLIRDMVSRHFDEWIAKHRHSIFNSHEYYNLQKEMSK